MNLSTIVPTVTKLGGKVYLVGLKYLPHIMTGLGVAGFVGTNVLTRRAALNEEMVIAKADDEIEVIKQTKAETAVVTGVPDESQPYPEHQYNKDLAKAYLTKGLNIAKLYGPPVACGVVSVGLLIGGHMVLQDRYTGVLMAYNGLDAAFRKYRAKTKEVVGAEKEEDIRMGVSDKLTTDENGNDTMVKTVSDDVPATYTALFGKGLSTQWQDDPDMNWFFLSSKQEHFNDRLTKYGYVFLNDILKELGLPGQFPVGQHVGWFDDGDGLPGPQIKFGLPEAATRWSYGNRYDPILLDFNCDGVIIDLID
jgi:Family of unknown function (DUF6353)